MLRKLLALLLLASTLPGSGVYAAEETASSPEGEHFFETHIRPILVEKCQDCHGAKKQWAELRLDSRENLLKGGESGPAAVPGKPTDSRLIQVIQYSENDSQMPPDGKLSEEQIARLTEWVSMGAPWPKSTGEEAALDFFQQAATHWAFQPIRQPRIPAMDDSYRIANAVDHFVADKLRGASLPQSPRAEPRALLRRLSFDLTGLPTTFEETEAFAANPTDEAYEAQVARLLASPEFGPKWARYWLDIARYADTKGYVFTEERRYPFAYTYRDYVIKALNEDLPYDQFLREQLAADLLPEKRTDEALAALGFLTVGNRFLNRVQDILDDRIDVTTRGLMGVTLACCRCHDHKFDPLEAADYYALYGVFESSFEPESLPQIGEAQDAEAYAKYLTELNQREQARTDYLKQVAEKVNAEVRGHLEHYLLAIVQEAGHQMGRYELEAKYELRPRVKEHLLRHLRGNSTDDPVLGLWRRLQNLKDEEFGNAGRDRIGKLLADFEEGRYPGNPVLMQRLREQPPAHMYEVVKLYADLFRLADQTDREIPEAEQAAWAQLRGVWTAESSPLVFTESTVASVFQRDERNKERELTQKIDQLTVNSPGAPPRAMVLADKDQPVSPVIFKRGNPGLRGDPVPRRFLKVLDFVRAEPFGPKASGRLELAQAITSPENPLTARVLVNRIWMQLIGRPLVESTDDFGLRTPPPTHPELLDYLAYEFMQHDWSVKWLIREIVMSEAYRQTTLTHPTGVRVDIENRLVWRMNRKRLPFESMRDAMLLGAGQLDLRQFGRPEELEGKNPSRRRSVFGYVDRNNVSNLLRTFDVAGPNASVSERARTTVPQQALYVMNSPFIMGLADEIASRLQADTSTTDDRERTRKLYRQLLQRNPSDEETELCLAYLQSADAGGSWRELAQTLLLTNEFLFLD
ncbi:MAG: PSD1 domain-containing protein [Planctomycetaceae bacterium]|nr:PSD1 domain-containing protein [Planctomycetaceae bacterium]